MTCKDPQCNEPRITRGHYCEEHQNECDQIAIEKMINGVPLPEGHGLKERFTRWMQPKKKDGKRPRLAIRSAWSAAAEAAESARSAAWYAESAETAESATFEKMIINGLKILAGETNNEED